LNTEDEERRHPSAVRSVAPQEVWRLLQEGDAQLLDVRTEIERRRYGAPPGAISVSLAQHVLNPEGTGTIYLCQHAVRSKATLRNGAAEVAGGFVAWQRTGLPIEKVD
jgi:rhodanese-related sulfurtransferase